MELFFLLYNYKLIISNANIKASLIYIPDILINNYILIIYCLILIILPHYLYISLYLLPFKIKCLLTYYGIFRVALKEPQYLFITNLQRTVIRAL